MRHAVRSQHLSRPSAPRAAMLRHLTRSVMLHGQIRTTYARAKETQRIVERLVTLGKDGSLHARRQAFRVLQDRTLVKQLFGDIAPVFLDVAGGYTRVLRLAMPRRGDGAQLAVLAFSRLPVAQPAKPQGRKLAEAPSPQPTSPEVPEKPKGFFEGLRTLWTRKRKGSVAS